MVPIAQAWGSGRQVLFVLFFGCCAGGGSAAVMFSLNTCRFGYGGDLILTGFRDEEL